MKLKNLTASLALTAGLTGLMGYDNAQAGSICRNSVSCEDSIQQYTRFENIKYGPLNVVEESVPFNMAFHDDTLMLVSYVNYGFLITVRQGDNLGSLADKLNRLGRKEATGDNIYQQNRDVIGDNPNLVKPETKLKYRTSSEFCKIKLRPRD